MDAEKIDLMMRMLPDGVSRRDFLRTAAAGAAGAAGTLALPKRGRAQTPKKGGTLVYGSGAAGAGLEAVQRDDLGL